MKECAQLLQELALPPTDSDKRMRKRQRFPSTDHFIVKSPAFGSVAFVFPRSQASVLRAAHVTYTH